MYCTSYWIRPYQLIVISQVFTVTSDTLPDLMKSFRGQLQALSHQSQQAARNELRPHVCSKWTLLGKLNYLLSIVVSRARLGSRAELAWLLETRALVGMFRLLAAQDWRRYVLSLCWYKGAGWSPSQTQPTLARMAFSITHGYWKWSALGVGWVWLARLGAGHLR